MVTQFRFIGHLQSVTFDFYDCEIFLMQFKSPYVIDVLAVTNIQVSDHMSWCFYIDNYWIVLDI